MHRKSLKGVLLDVDGTLIDSNDAHAASFVEAFAAEGISVDFDRVRALIGMGGDKLFPVLGIEPRSKAGEKAARAKKEIFRERYLPELRAFPAARDLLDHMKRRGLELVVASSASTEELRGLLKQGSIEHLIDDQSSADDAEASKPDPDIILAAIARSTFEREDLVMLGDTPYDVEAATRAGVPIVALRCGGWSDEDLKGAVEVYDGPQDLLAHFDESYFGTRV